MNYTTLASLATKMITAYGKGATVIKNSASFNAETGENTLTPTSKTCFCVEDTIDIKSKDGSLIQTNDRLFYIAADFAIELTDFFTVGGVNYKIVDITPIQPGATVIMYKVLVRK